MQYSKNQQVRKNKREVYGNKIPRKNAREVIARSKNRCSFMYAIFGMEVNNCELHHIHGRKNKAHKHDPSNLIYISSEVHRAYHSQGYFKYQGITMHREEMKQWFIDYNSRIYGRDKVEECR